MPLVFQRRANAISNAVVVALNRVGANMQGFAYADTEQPFLNVCKSSSSSTNGPWDTNSGADRGGNLDQDSDGYCNSLTGLDSTVYTGVHTTFLGPNLNQPGGGNPGNTTGLVSFSPLGTYRFQCTGIGTLTLSGNVDASSVANPLAFSGLTITGNQIVSTNSGAWSVTFSMTGSTSTGIRLDITAIPASATRPRAIAIVHSMWTSLYDAGEIFTPYFLDSFKYRCRIRFMDALQTNQRTPVMTFTGSLLASATSATLSSAFTGRTGTYRLMFSSGEFHDAALVNNATTCTFAALTNANTATFYLSRNYSWSTRPLPSNLMFGPFGSGIPVEYMISLGNKLAGIDLHVNLGIDSFYDSSYAANMAAMFHTGAGATISQATSGFTGGGKVLIEYSNEIWNPGFDAFGFANTIGNSVYPAAGANAQQQWVSTKIADVCDAFSTEYGGAFNSKIQIGVGQQTAAPSGGDTYMKVAMNFVYNGQALYARLGASAVMLFAPYYGSTPSSGDQTTILAQGDPILEYLKLGWTNHIGANTYSSINSAGYVGANVATMTAMAASFVGQPWAAVPMIGYEGGEGFVCLGQSTPWHTFIFSVSRDPRCGLLLNDKSHVLSANDGYLPAMKTWFDSINLYSNTFYFSEGGNWGQLENIMQITLAGGTPLGKFQQADNYALGV